MPLSITLGGKDNSLKKKYNMKLSQLIKILNNILIEHGDINVFLSPRTYMPKRIHRLGLTKQDLYIANKKTKPELQFKLDVQ